jgi:hypothetical protein
MSDSPGATRATIIHDITEDTNLQDLVANGSVGRASLKTTVTSAAGNPGNTDPCGKRVAQIIGHRYCDAIPWRRHWFGYSYVPLGHKPERLSPIHDRSRAPCRQRDPQRII